LTPLHLVAEKSESDDEIDSGDTAFEAISLAELRFKAEQSAVPEPNKRPQQTIVRERSRAIKAYVLRRAEGTCEGCDSFAPFVTVNGRPYLEPHHIHRLSDGGPDDLNWIAAVC